MNLEVPSNELFEKLPQLYQTGVTEFYVHDRKLAKDKKSLLALADLVADKCPELFISLPVEARLIDMPLLEKLSELYVSVEIPLEGELKGGNLALNKKLYKGKTASVPSATGWTSPRASTPTT